MQQQPISEPLIAPWMRYHRCHCNKTTTEIKHDSMTSIYKQVITTICKPLFTCRSYIEVWIPHPFLSHCNRFKLRCIAYCLQRCILLYIFTICLHMYIYYTHSKFSVFTHSSRTFRLSIWIGVGDYYFKFGI